MKDVKKKGGSKLFSNVFSDEDYGALQIGGMLSDVGSRMNKQGLLEADALRSAYGIRGSLADDYEKGLGGADMVEGIGKYMGYRELAKRRDDVAEMLRRALTDPEKKLQLERDKSDLRKDIEDYKRLQKDRREK